jgi:hypothetical protein
MDHAVFVFVFVGGSRGCGFGNEVVDFTGDRCTNSCDGLCHCAIKVVFGKVQHLT